MSKLVMVDWEDSRRPISNWLYESELGEMSVVACKTVGWLIEDGDAVKVIAQTYGNLGSDDVQVSGIMQIPARSVVTIQTLAVQR